MGETIGSLYNRIRCTPSLARGLYSCRRCQRLVVGTANQLFSAFPGIGHGAPKAETDVIQQNT